MSMSAESDEPLLAGSMDELPESVHEEFDNVSESQEDIHIAVSTDMNLDGFFEDSWLVATNERILVFGGDHNKEPEIVDEMPIADVRHVRLKNYVGNGVLEVQTASESIELLRFSKTAFNKNGIADVPRAIDNIREQNGHHVEKSKAYDHGHERGHRKVNRCENCGSIIRRGTTCPNCLEKRTLLARLFGYLKPYWFIAAVAFALSVITVGLGRLVPPVIAKQIVDRVLKPVVTTTETQGF